MLKLRPLAVNTSQSYSQDLIEALVIPRVHDRVEPLPQSLKDSWRNSVHPSLLEGGAQFLNGYWPEASPTILSHESLFSRLQHENWLQQRKQERKKG